MKVPASRSAADQPTWLGAHVGPAVAADLGLVVDPTERDADEGTPEGARDRLAERRLADAGRADQCEDAPRTAAAAHRGEPALGLQLAHREVFEDAVLHVPQAVVVLVEDARRLGDVQPVLGLLAPGQLGDRIQPGADPSALGALLVRALELVDLAIDRLAHLFGQLPLVELRPVVVGVLVVPVGDLTELLADGLELAAQEEFALGLLHALLDVGLDPLAQGQVGEHLAGPVDDQTQARLDVDRLEHLHLLFQRQVGRVPGHVGDPSRVGDVGEALGEPARAAGHEDVLEHGAVLACELRCGLCRGRVRHRVDLDPQSLTGPRHRGAEPGAVDPADGDGGQPAGKLAALHHLGDHAHRRVAALDEGHDHELAARRLGGAGSGLGLVGLEGHGEHHARENHTRGEGQQWQVVGQWVHRSSGRHRTPD